MRKSILIALAIVGMGSAVNAQDAVEVRYQQVIVYQEAIDPEAIILIEDMLEYAEWDIQGGMMDAHIGMLLIANLEDLKAKLESK